MRHPSIEITQKSLGVTLVKIECTMYILQLNTTEKKIYFFASFSVTAKMQISSLNENIFRLFDRQIFSLWQITLRSPSVLNFSIFFCQLNNSLHFSPCLHCKYLEMFPNLFQDLPQSKNCTMSSAPSHPCVSFIFCWLQSLTRFTPLDRKHLFFFLFVEDWRELGRLAILQKILSR